MLNKERPWADFLVFSVPNNQTWNHGPSCWRNGPRQWPLCWSENLYSVSIETPLRECWLWFSQGSRNTFKEHRVRWIRFYRRSVNRKDRSWYLRWMQEQVCRRSYNVLAGPVLGRWVAWLRLSFLSLLTQGVEKEDFFLHLWACSRKHRSRFWLLKWWLFDLVEIPGDERSFDWPRKFVRQNRIFSSPIAQRLPLHSFSLMSIRIDLPWFLIEIHWNSLLSKNPIWAIRKMTFKVLSHE